MVSVLVCLWSLIIVWLIFLVSWSVSPTDSEVDLETLMERMKSLSQKAEECSQEEAVKRFETVETQSAEIYGAAPAPHVKADVGHFVEDPSFLYQDFAKRGIHDIATFRVQVWAIYYSRVISCVWS